MSHSASLASRTGLWTAIALFVLEALYIGVLGIGLLTLPDPDTPIQNPWFTAMEILILCMAPLLVILFICLHYRTKASRRPWSMAALGFMLGLCILTTGLHFAILTLSWRSDFSEPPWSTLVFPFRWPSLAYAVDIVAWDIFWPLSLLCAACALEHSRRQRWLKSFMLLSALLSALGLLGVALDDMDYRNIGIVGYVPVFMIVLALLIPFFRRGENNALEPPGPKKSDLNTTRAYE